MIEYLQKFILCSLLLYSVYHLFLRNEKTFRFNRLYLLLIIPLSLTIPIVTVQTSYVEIPTMTQTFIDVPLEQPLFYIPTELGVAEEEPAATNINWKEVTYYSYFFICLILFIRFALNLYRLKKFKNQGHLVKKERYQLCLRDDLKSSFTFLNTIYTNKSKYLAELLPSSILEHEKAHVFQKHSYDIILMELLNTALWFNPLLYFIKQSIKLNHEFLADEAVYETSSSLPDYQWTLINYSKLNSSNEPILTSRLTFGETKKRLKMMVKKTHKSTEWLKQSIGLVAIAIAVFTLGNRKVIAQQSDEEIYSEYRVLTEYEYFNGKDSVRNFYRGPFPDSDELIRMINKDGTLTEKPFGKLNLAEQMRFPDHSAKTQFFDKEKGTWRNLGGIERVIIMSNAAQKASQESPNIDQKDIHRDSTLLGKKVAPLIQLSPDTKVRYLNEADRRVESEFGKLNREQRTRFASPDAEGEVWTNSFMDSNLKWRSYREMLEEAKRLKNGVLPNFYKSADEPRSENEFNQVDTIPNVYNRLFIKRDALVRYIDTSGNLIEKKYNKLTLKELERFGENSANPQFFVPKTAKMEIPENFAEVFADEKVYGVWLDEKRIKNSELKNYSADEIHHYFKSELMKNAKNYGVHTFQLNIYTDQYMKGRPEGNWINLLTIPEGGVNSMKNSKNDNKTQQNERGQLYFNGFDTAKVEHFLVPTPNTPVKFFDQRKKLIVDEWKNLSFSQKRQWYTKGHEGMIFNPPNTVKEITYQFLQNIIDETNVEIWLDDKKVGKETLNSIYPHELYNFSRVETPMGKSIYTFITKKSFLAEKWLDTYWVSNVIYKKSDADE